MKKTILMILNKDFPNVRVCQEIDALRVAGYIVYVVIKKNPENASPEYDINDFNTIELDLTKSKLNYFHSMMTYKHPDIENKLLNNRIFKSIRSDIFAIHVHGLYWANFARTIANKINAKLVLDLHENYPALREFFGTDKATSIKALIINFLDSTIRIRKHESQAIQFSDATLVVVEENGIRLQKNHAKSKIICVSNTKDPQCYKYMGINRKSESINIFYHGTIQKLRGLRTVIESMKYLNNSKYTLTIVGFAKGCLEKEYILDYFNQNIPSNIKLINWTNDFKLIQKYIQTADICVIPHEKCELTETTVPNKIFEYFCYGKPSIVSNVAPLERIVKETNAGLIFEAGNAKDLANKLNTIQSKNNLIDFSKNARQAAENTYHWGVDSKRLIDLYKELIDL